MKHHLKNGLKCAVDNIFFVAAVLTLWFADDKATALLGATMLIFVGCYFKLDDILSAIKETKSVSITFGRDGSTKTRIVSGTADSEGGVA